MVPLENLHGFIDSCLLSTLDPDKKMAYRDIHAYYKQYANHFQLLPASKRALGEALGKRFYRIRSSKEIYYFCELREELIK